MQIASIEVEEPVKRLPTRADAGVEIGMEERSRSLMGGEEDGFEHAGTETISVRMGRGHDAGEDFIIDPISTGHDGSASLGNILDGAGENDRQRDEAYLKVRCFLSLPVHACGGRCVEEREDRRRGEGGGREEADVYLCFVAFHFVGMIVLRCIHFVGMIVFCCMCMSQV